MNQNQYNLSSKNNMTPKSTQKLVEKHAKELFTHLGIPATFTVSQDPDTEYLVLQIDTDATGLIIGYRGETLSAVQQILSHQLKKETGEWHRLIVNVGGYRQQREQTLIQLAQNAAKKVEFSGEPYVFTNLTPPERRIVHMTLQDNTKVTTESQGDGKHRQLVIKTK